MRNVLITCERVIVKIFHSLGLAEHLLPLDALNLSSGGSGHKHSSKIM